MQAEKEAQELAATENTRYYAGVMNEAGAKIGRIEKELEVTNNQLAERDAELAAVTADREEAPQLAAQEQNPATANKELPEAANVLKDLRKALGKKSTASLADVETILEIIEGDGNE